MFRKAKYPFTTLSLIILVIGLGFIGYTAAVIWEDTPAPQVIVQEPKTDCRIDNCIALTFDDGPTEFTSTLLDTLDQYDIKATFFYIGQQIEQYPKEVARAHKAGHEIGNHTWDHASVEGASARAVRDQLDRTEAAIESITGEKPMLFRPPGGEYDEATLAQVSMPLIMWSIDPEEWRELDADTIYKTITERVEPGAVVISHDTRASTIEAYTRIIPFLIDEGYTFVTISELFDLDPQNPEIKAYYSLSR
jgi:peptidoglycan-N-acetylglucosamine deacetylase